MGKDKLSEIAFRAVDIWLELGRPALFVFRRRYAVTARDMGAWTCLTVHDSDGQRLTSIAA